jgi:hypothetical protein
MGALSRDGRWWTCLFTTDPYQERRGRNPVSPLLGSAPAATEAKLGSEGTMAPDGHGLVAVVQGHGCHQDVVVDGGLRGGAGRLHA